MARSFEIDMSAFMDALEKAPEVVSSAAKRGLHDALDDWKRESTDIAPLDKGTLRRGISTHVEGDGLDLTGSVTASAVEVTSRGKWAGKRFNYAYWLHEEFPKKHGESFENPTTSGTVPQFLDKVAEKNEKKWVDDIENEIKVALKAEGW